jgi:integrase
VIRKRGKTWMFTVEQGRDPVTGQRRRPQYSGYRTKRDAERAHADLVSRVQRGDYVADSHETVAEFLAAWLDGTAHRVRPSTLESYGRNLRTHAIPVIGHKRLQALTGSDLNALYSKLLADGRRNGPGGLKPRTVRYIHTIIHRALKDALRWNKVTRNVADAADPPSHTASKPPEMTTWTADHVRSFLAHVNDDRLAAVWRLAATTGMRRGELCGLKWIDVDLDTARVAVRRALVQVGYAIEWSTPKTERGRRNVALDANTVTALREHRARQAAERLAIGVAYHDHGLVFCREDGQLIHPERLSRLFERHRTAARLPKIRLHDLRHTHATLALQAGIHPKVVSERIGHADIALTLNTYSHAIPALQESAATLIAELIS